MATVLKINGEKEEIDRPPVDIVVNYDAIFRFITSGHNKLGLRVSREKSPELISKTNNVLYLEELNVSTA